MPMPRRSKSDVDPDEASNEAIPEDAITLSEAYGLLLARIELGLNQFPPFDEDDRRLLTESRREEDEMQPDKEGYDAETADWWHTWKEANLFLRRELEAGHLAALIWEPRAAEAFRVPRDGWVPARWCKSPAYIPSGIWSDFIHPNAYEELGPDGTLIEGKLRRVFFRKRAFAIWMEQRLIAVRKRRRGRPLGAGSYIAIDMVLLRRMADLIRSRQVASPEEAARSVALDAKGGTEPSKITRLAKTYRKLAERMEWPHNPG